MSKRMCARCRDRLASKTSAYCNPCSAEYQAERRRGEHKPDRLCDVCGEHFKSRGDTTLCRPCRESPDRQRICTNCGVQFVTHKGTQMRCGACRRKRAEYMKSHYRDHYRQVRVDKTFALEPGQFDRMLKEQDNKCAVCKREFADTSEIEDLRKANVPVPYVDHDHGCCDFNPSMSHPLCGKCVRQLVCFRCNVMLGSAADSVEILTSAAAYLQRWSVRAD